MIEFGLLFGDVADGELCLHLGKLYILGGLPDRKVVS